jgi:hypothetical protein
VRIAYADPPYPGCAHYYEGHPDYAGEVDHDALLARLRSDFDGFVLHTHVPGLVQLAPKLLGGERVMAWVKPFAAFKRNVSVAYAWEPVIVKACRKPVVTKRVVMRDWIAESITLKKGLTGAKPPKVVRWAFEMVGAQLGDSLVDLFPGTGIVGATWKEWQDERMRESVGAGFVQTLRDLHAAPHVIEAAQLAVDSAPSPGDHGGEREGT